MTPATKPKANRTKHERSERLKELVERIRKKGLQPWVKKGKIK